VLDVLNRVSHTLAERAIVDDLRLLLAMQKVEGSSPFSRFAKKPRKLVTVRVG
jgi:hypothetical protein